MKNLQEVAKTLGLYGAPCRDLGFYNWITDALLEYHNDPENTYALPENFDPYMTKEQILKIAQLMLKEFASKFFLEEDEVDLIKLSTYFTNGVEDDYCDDKFVSFDYETPINEKPEQEDENDE